MTKLKDVIVGQRFKLYNLDCVRVLKPDNTLPFDLDNVYYIVYPNWKEVWRISKEQAETLEVKVY